MQATFKVSEKYQNEWSLKWNSLDTDIIHLGSFKLKVNWKKTLTEKH